MPKLQHPMSYDVIDVWESLPEGFVALDKAWNFTYVNANAAQLMRRRREDLLGHSLWQEFPQARGTQFQWQYQKAVAEQSPVDFEAFFGPLDAWYEVHARPLAEGLAIYFRDVSAEHAAAERAAHAIQFSQSLLDAVDPSVVVLDESANILVVNQSWRDFAAANGIALADAGVGANYLRMCDRAGGHESDDSPRVAAAIRSLLAGERTEFILEYLRHGEGGQRWFRLRISRFEDAGLPRLVLCYQEIDDGPPARDKEGDIAVAEDDADLNVSPHRTQELERINRALIAESMERQLVMERLRQTVVQLESAHAQTEQARALAEQARHESEVAKLEAEKANQAKSQFFSRMSHELRTPLNAILGFGQILEMGDLGARDAEGVGHILKGGKHLLGLINEVLEISRFDAGELSLSLEPVSVRQVVRETIELLRPQSQSFGIEIVNEVDGAGERYVMADAQRLRQVLLNLGSNGIKYNRGAGRVTFFTQLQGNSGRLLIGVRDTGFGLTPEDTGKVFTPFERLDAAKRGIEGTGIGLTLCRRLVGAMAGTLEVQSAPGQGSTFTVNLAVAEAPMQRTAVTSAAWDELRRDGEVGNVAVKKLLCIEDNLANLHLIEMLLEKRRDIRVMAAMQGSTGLDLAREHRPDLILLDLHLPDIGGQEVLRRLREDPGTREIPVVIVSADATTGQVQRLLVAGARNYITKPIEVRGFLEIVNEVLHPATLH